MAKPLVFELADQQFSFVLASKVDKAALYGYAKRIAEKDGKELSRGTLLPDGRLLARGAIGYPKADDGGTPIDAPVAHVLGATIEQLPSSFDKVSPLAALPLTELVLFSVRDVYPVSSAVLPAVGLYRCEFNYRAGYQANEARLLVRADGLAFLLVGVSKASQPVSKTVNYDFFDLEEEHEESEDELDFAMV
jgi:hypothetical protein